MCFWWETISLIDLNFTFTVEWNLHVSRDSRAFNEIGIGVIVKKVACMYESVTWTRTVGLTLATFYGPVVIAVVVHSAMSVVEKTVLTMFQGQCAICTQVEGTAVFRMRVRLFSPRLWTIWDVVQCNSMYQTYKLHLIN